MSQARVAVPYAKALLDVAVAQKTVSKLRTQVEALGVAWERSVDLRQVFSNPTVTLDERRAVIDALAKQNSLDRTLRNFLMVLAEKRRLRALGEIATEFLRLADQHEGILRARAFASTEMSMVQKSRLKRQLAEQTGKKIELEVVVDPTILGGLRIQVGSKMYDASLRTRLQGLRDSLLQAK
jgi:F-type H+-transporting ATPase subunit delta